MKYKSLLVIFSLILFSQLAFAESDDLESNFKNPPDSAKPHTWWHWMNGNISREGITADLEAMVDVGIGGAQIFNVKESIPLGPSPVLSSQWFDLIEYAAKEADRLGIELCLHNCPGWSCSGGPWITPEYSMQEVTYCDVNVVGPCAFNELLPQPEAKLDFYRDIAILAFPKPEDDNFRIDDFKAKIGWYEKFHDGRIKFGRVPDLSYSAKGAIIDIDSIVDLTDKFDADGKLKWQVPAGKWTIMRFGHTTTGRTNRPAPDFGKGLECDKLRRQALDEHWEKGIQPILDKVGPLVGKTVNNLLIDSYEVGYNNWTPEMRAEFKKHTGYDLLKYLPVFAGRVIGSAADSERFMWDFRRVNSELFVDNYFSYFAEKCHKRGIMSSVEPYYGPFESTEAGAEFDIIMGEFWMSGDGDHEVGYGGSTKLAASSAHVHGQKFVGAEAFTSGHDNGRWQNYPGKMKILGDQIWCTGINRFIFHRYAHQPWMNVFPGMTMGPWGSFFERTNTWWNQSKEWMKYLARSQYLLQEGKFVADILYFAGESLPTGKLEDTKVKKIGYDCDYIGTQMIEKLKVKDGLLVLPDAMQYKVLVLPETEFMTLAFAEKIRSLVKAGAIVIAPKPRYSPTLVRYPEDELKLQAVADDLWGQGDCTKIDKKIGQGRIISGVSEVQVLQDMQISPDFVDMSDEVKTSFIHRKIGKADVYFVASRKKYPNEVKCSFRITGKKPELWDAVTGNISEAGLYKTEKDKTLVTLDLPASGSVFVVFREPVDNEAVTYVAVESDVDINPCISNEQGRRILKAAKNGLYKIAKSNSQETTINVSDLPAPIEIDGSWKLKFTPNWGAPNEVILDKLISWTDHKLAGVRYYSGTATYFKTFNLSDNFICDNQRIELDLGEVKCFAEVKVNSKSYNVLWTHPFKLDITDAVKAGANNLEVAVTNLWPNRLIGDAQYPDDRKWWDGKCLSGWPEWFVKKQPSPVKERFTFTTWNHWHKDDKLLSSGLIGPVIHFTEFSFNIRTLVISTEQSERRNLFVISIVIFPTAEPHQYPSSIFLKPPFHPS